MIGTTPGRFLIASIAAVWVHLVVFFTCLPHNRSVRPPQPVAVQRIAVSLGCRPTTVPEQETEPEPAHLPEKMEELPVPVKPEPRIREKGFTRPKITPRHINKTTPDATVTNKRTARKKSPPPPLPQPSQATDTGEEQIPAETASRVLREAPPLYQLNPPPKYPRLARRRGYEGVVILEVFVDEYGRPSKVTLSLSSGYSLLDKAAIQAVQRWHFQPGTINAVPQRMQVKVPIRFQLNNS